MNISDLCAEIMKQNYTSILGKNYSKLAILLFLKQNNFQLKKTSLMRVCQFTYRFFRDNIQYGKESNYVIIKNIEQYMPEDLTLIVKTELNEWVVNGQNVLLLEEDSVLTNPSITLSDSDLIMAHSLTSTIIKQNFGEDVIYKEDIDINRESIPFSNYDDYVQFIANTRLYNRGFETLNYCCCCDKTGKDLVCLHINPLLDINDPNNTLIFCYEHGELYFRKYFNFLKSGKIKIQQDNNNLDNRMHLSRKVLLNKRKFLEEE